MDEPREAQSERLERIRDQGSWRYDTILVLAVKQSFISGTFCASSDPQLNLDLSQTLQLSRIDREISANECFLTFELSR